MNDGDEPLKALVYVADVQIDAAGEQTYVTPKREGAALLSTPASWFRIYMPADSKSVGNTPYVELEPGERIPIRFEFSPPSGTAPGDHNTVIFFEMFEFADASGSSSALVGGRLGARVALRVNGDIVEKLQIRPFEAPQFVIGSQVPLTFTVRNDGNVNKRVEVAASLFDRNERAITEAAVATDTAIYAGSARQFTSTLIAPGGRIGPHTVEVVAEYVAEGAQTSSELVEERAVWLIPLWLVVLAGFMVLYALLFVASRAFRGRRRVAPVAVPADTTEEPEAVVSRRAVSKGRHSRRMRETEAELRRRRREERAAGLYSAGDPASDGDDADA